jgi:hypothetical protein
MLATSPKNMAMKLKRIDMLTGRVDGGDIRCGHADEKSFRGSGALANG